jgi:hypothetical protein
MNITKANLTSRAALATVICMFVVVACADRRLDRSDDEAMMVYRECMAGAPPALNSAEMSSTLSNSRTADANTSIAANARTQQEESHELHCMQLAGWKKE